MEILCIGSIFEIVKNNIDITSMKKYLNWFYSDEIYMFL